jgi:ubiquitin conjugation factor E4 B
LPLSQLDGAANDNAPSTPQTSQQPEGKRIKITPSTQASVPERPRSTGPSSAQTNSPAKPSPQSIEDFEHQVLGVLFNITVKEGVETNDHRISLPGLRSELQDEGKELRLHTGILDQAILEAASKAEKQRPLDYLLPCWSRIQERMKKPDPDTRRWDVYCEAKRLCLSYCIFAITMPEMFGYENKSHLDNLSKGADDIRAQNRVY